VGEVTEKSTESGKTTGLDEKVRAALNEAPLGFFLGYGAIARL